MSPFVASSASRIDTVACLDARTNSSFFLAKSAIAPPARPTSVTNELRPVIALPTSAPILSSTFASAIGLTVAVTVEVDVEPP